ncbi:PKD domain-containing protein [Flagellimonas sp. S174]|uniref:PKD domain-containing protein n=1 Tax=Flagellimonas sp. S174 TaxID=3410790 RepID=UPI003BF58CB0
MGYTVDIIDTWVDDHIVELERARYSSIRLKWNGSDSKDDRVIIGSSFFFTLEAHISKYKDSMFSHLFTSGETRYKVRLSETDTDVTIWTGFLLPESYGEPYTNNTFYVDLEATDALGRLKGKYLEDTFYSETEFSVVEIFSKCLRLTGLELSMMMSPAIKNIRRDNYSDIYIPGNYFTDNDEILSAYEILDTLGNDMLCRIFQCDNFWYIEGLNQLHQSSVAYDRFTYLGVFEERVKKPRLIKRFNPQGTPFVSTIAPYKTVRALHKREKQALPDTIGDEKNDGWSIGQGVEGDIFPTHWYGNNVYYPKALAPNYKVTFPVLAGVNFNSPQFASLLRKVYVKQGDKMLFSISLKSPVSARLDDGNIVPNGFKLTFDLNGETLYSTVRNFDDDTLEFSFDLNIPNNGLLDLFVARPFFDGTLEDGTFPQFITLEEIRLERIGFQEQEIFENIINEEYSTEKELELTISDDATGFSKAFRLQKLNEKGADFNSIDVNILYSRVFQGVNYLVFSLFDANLIADNIGSVYDGGQKVDGLKVHYNLFEGEEMAVEAPSGITDGSLEVRRFKVDDVTEDRDYWEEWSDTVYQVERDRYGVAAAKVLRRMFEVPFERIDFTSESAYKLNDLISFSYVLAQFYFLTNVEWSLDTGKSTGSMVRAVYENEITTIGTGNKIPIVNAGDDVKVDFIGLAGVQLEAIAFDPDGFIAAVQWELVSGSGVIITNGDTLKPTIFPQTSGLTNLSELPVTLRVTVTDDDGATASDEVTILEEQSYNLVLTDTLNTRDNPVNGEAFGFTQSDLSFSPALADDLAITVKGDFNVEILQIPPGAAYTITCVFSVFKNGVKFLQNVVSENRAIKKLEGDFEFGFFRDDDVRFEITAFATLNALVNNQLDFKAEYEITNIEVQNGAGVFNGYPVGREAHYDYPSWQA